MNTSTLPAGNYDPNFGVLGRAELPQFISQGRNITDIALQQENILASALAFDSSGRRYYAMTRFSANGEIDLHFADEGIKFGLFNSEEQSSTEALAVTEDEHILLLGWSAAWGSQLTKPVICWFSPDGAGPTRTSWLGVPDDTGLVIGKNRLTVNAQHLLASINLLATQDRPGTARVYRQGLDGTPGFGSLEFIEILPGDDDVSICGLVQLPDTFLVSGTQALGKPEQQGFIACYRNDGTLDPSFGAEGVIRLRAAEQPTSLNHFLQRPSGELIVAGCAHAGNPLRNHALLWQFTQNGSPDTSFNNGEPVLTDLSPPLDNSWHSMTLALDNKLVVIGEGNGIRYMRFMPNGTVDTQYQPFDGLAGITEGIGCLARLDNTLLCFNSTAAIGVVGTVMSIFS
ncbi:hypothetical protein [Pseudomonas sp. UM16]|uniref:hypothetical protein n=1 Tax=Pseudomonas sp. UM16 TaxID=3158962 RepID=UPI00398FE393